MFETRVALATAMEESTLSYAGEPSFLRSNFQRGVKRLPIAWSAA
jgi:hypothetical protein